MMPSGYDQGDGDVSARDRAFTPEETSEAYVALREKNAGRLRALAVAGTPIQVNGLEEHLLMVLVVGLLGEPELTNALFQWEQKVSANLDGFETVIRQQKLLQR